MIRKIYKISGMHCTSCAMNIEWELEDVGVKAKCNYAKAELEIEHDGGIEVDEKVKLAVEKAGYKII